MIGRHGIAKRVAVVVGAATLVAGTLANTSPASAHWHRSDVGTGVATGAAAGLALAAITDVAVADVNSAYDPGATSCTWEWQRAWDGYGWQVRHVEVCN